MKNMKKIFSLVLALVMMMALTVTAGATGMVDGGSITIENPTVGQQYDVYKLFDVYSVNEGKKLQSYKVNDAWAGFFNQGDGKDYIDVLKDGFVSWKADKKDAETVANFAKVALAYAKGNGIAAVATETVAEGATTVVFSGLKLGYYLVDSTVGTLCTLDVNSKDITIKDKNVKPTIEKTTTDNTENTKRVGETIDYKVVIHAKEGAQNYVLTDTMSTGLELVTGSVVANDGASENLVKDTDYTLTESASGFTMNFTEKYLDGISGEDGKTITVTYKATITADAITVDEFNNAAKLEFGDPEHKESTEVERVSSKVLDFDFVKHDSKNAPLAKAEFSLFTDAACENIVKLVAVAGEENTYRVATDKDTETEIVTVVTTPADGKITIKGLGNNTYYLKEIKAPEGYNLLANAVEVKFEGVDIKTSFDAGTEKWNGIGVLNQTGTELPDTGGIGTTIFTVTGGLLMIGAAVLLLTKKRSEG